MKIFVTAMAGLGLAMGAGARPAGGGAGQDVASASMDGKTLITMVAARETDASNHRGRYMYLSVERSERTNGHEWTERVAETDWGKVRYLLAEDGKPLTGERLAAERARIEDEGKNPEIFKQAESGKMEDEQHARQMMTLLPKAFLFDQPQREGDFWRVTYHPNPEYQPNGMEEKVLHAMSGTVLIDANAIRTHELEGKMPQDVSIGFGILATIHAGSNFSTVRDHIDGYDWKTVMVHTDINGKALFLKTVARKQEAKHTEFKRIPNGITVEEAVKMVEAA
jgi:hypothetical protein